MISVEPFSESVWIRMTKLINQEQSCYAPVTVDYSPMAGTAGVVIVTSVHSTQVRPLCTLPAHTGHTSGQSVQRHREGRVTVS